MFKIDKRKMINIILACDNNWGIGINNDLLYSFASDLKRFKEFTKGNTIVMGRKTWESLPGKLPNRNHVVLTRQSDIEGADQVVNSVDEVLKLAETEDVWIIGGAEIYKQFCQHADRLEITHINAERENDTDVKFLKEVLNEIDIVNEEKLVEKDRISGEDLEIRYVTYE
jgi:dihydrofolate reductase